MQFKVKAIFQYGRVPGTEVCNPELKYSKHLQVNLP